MFGSRAMGSYRMWRVCVFGFVSMLSMVGCVSVPQLINDRPDQSIPELQQGKAQIIFLNPSNSVAGAFLSEIYDLPAGDKKLLGMAGSKMKIVADVEPGDHMFMCRTGLRSHFMKAQDLEAGKRYYVLMRFIYGAGFQLRPIRKGAQSDYSPSNPDFDTWKLSTKIVDLTPGSEQWIKDNWSKAVEMSYKKYWVEWEGKSAEQQDELTLKSEDSI